MLAVTRAWCGLLVLCPALAVAGKSAHAEKQLALVMANAEYGGTWYGNARTMRLAICGRRPQIAASMTSPSAWWDYGP